jgi:valyl-tRNA synthetase
MPPPNITGKLHIGHALFSAIQDSLSRFYRKENYNSLWIPGLDHAGLATHDKILERLDQKEYSTTEYDSIALKLKNEHSNTIISQLKKTGASCDWNQIHYTLNDNFKLATTKALKKLNKHNLIYKKNNQWYISMKSFADKLLNDIENGFLEINSKSDLKSLIYTLKNIDDWCISRQIRWGLQMPIYLDHNDNFYILDDDESHEHLNRINDTFDTWFTSSLWIPAILGWGTNNLENFNNYYPTQMIETGADILFPWCAKMLMIGNFITGEYPFSEIYLHGICRDQHGIKMSKSLGNGIDPLDIINKYGADTLRLSLLRKTSSHDFKINENEFLDTSKFINKIYQAFRFINMHIDKNNIDINPNTNGTLNIHLIELKEDFLKSMYNRDFQNITNKLQYSFKHNFCDEWIETNKKEIFLGNKEIIQHGLYALLYYMNLFHCFIPFISDYIHTFFGYDDLILKEY